MKRLAIMAPAARNVACLAVWAACLALAGRSAHAAVGGSTLEQLTDQLEWEKRAAAGDDQGRPLADMNLEQLRRFQAFHYVRGGSDPLRYRTYTGRAGEAATAEPSARNRRPTDLEQEKALIEALRDAERLLMSRQYAAARARVDQMTETVDKEWQGISEGNTALEGLLRRLRETRLVADQYDRQLKASQDFAAANLDVAGVQWTPRGSALAIVGGRPYEVGMVLGKDKPLSEIRVDAIDERTVTFRFRGFRFQVEPKFRSGGKDGGKDAGKPLERSGANDAVIPGLEPPPASGPGTAPRR